MGKEKAPPAPDYAAAAKAQGIANIEAANATAGLNRPNQIDRNGTQQWTMREGADPKNPQPGDWVVTNKLSDTQESLAQLQDSISAKYGGLANMSMDQLKELFSSKLDTSNVPAAQQLTREGLSSFRQVPQQSSQEYGLPQVAVNEYSPEINQNRARLTTEGLREFGSVDKTSEESRQRITDALYARQTAMIDPQAKQQQGDLTSRLAAQGITEGSEAYTRAVDNQARQQGEQYANARNDAILAGGAEDSRIGGQNLDVARFANQTRGQEFDERGQIVNVDNSNIDTIFGQGLQRAGFNNNVRNTAFDQGMKLADFTKDTRRGAFGEGMAQVGAAAAQRGQQFGENQNITAANNTLHQNSLAEAVQQRQLALNEANALRTGGQVMTPNFQAYGGAGTVGAAPIFDATQAQYDAQMGGVNAYNASKGQMWQGLGQAAAAGAAAY